MPQSSVTEPKTIGVRITLTTPSGEKGFGLSFRFSRHVPWEALYLLVFPVLVFFGLHYQPRLQNQTLDPYIYTGYINNFSDLFNRYGATYYGVRFGLILPARLVGGVFGSEAGYFVLRYFLSLVFGLSLYAVCRRYTSPVVAKLMYAVAVGSPYFARALLWDHPDATGVPFLTAAICLMLLDGPRSRLRNLLAGCCAGMAINSNIFTIVPIGIFAVIHCAFSVLYGEQPVRVLLRMTWLAIGTLLVTAAGALYYGLAVGHFDIFSITLNMVYSLSHGGMLQWRAAGLAWTVTRYEIFVPVWLSICCLLVAGLCRWPFFTAVTTTYGVAVTAFYYVNQFVLNGNILQLFYYTSYLATATFLMAAIVLQFFMAYIVEHRATAAGVIVAGIFVPWLTISFGADYTRLIRLQHFAASAVAAILLIIAVTFLRRKRAACRLAIIGTVFFFGGFDLGFANYRAVIQNRAVADTTENDVYRVALQFIKAMPKFSGDPGDLLFLYDTRHQSLDSVQSTYLWGYSWVKYDRGAAPGRPSLGPDEVARLKQTARYLGLIGESSDEVEFEAQDLRSHNIPFRQLDERTLSSGSYRIFWRLLEVAQVLRTAVVNGDFESGTSPWAGGWAALRAVDGGQSGKCLELEGEQGDSQFAMEWNALKLNPGSNYRLRASVKSGSSGDEPFRVGLWDNKDNRWVASQDGRSTGTWIQYTIDFTAPSNHVLSCELMKNSRTKGSMLFDSVEVVPRD